MDLNNYKENPFKAPLIERYRLNPSSSKETYHLALDLKGSGIEYKVGDCLAIYPKNSNSDIEKILESLGASGDEIITDSRKGDSLPLSTFLSERANLSKVLKKLLIHLGLEGREFSDVSNLLASSSRGSITPSELVSYLLPLLPRFYSIASAPSEVGSEAHLTVTVTGVCSSFLCHEINLGQSLPLYLHPTSHFTLTDEMASQPVIMIGPGTGIAPFRGFMQERVKKGHSTNNWLFFGERQRAFDFYYESYFSHLVDKGSLLLETAFSRDQEEKIYVQHRMLERSSLLYEWIEKGAYLFVCGDADNMAKAVEKTLVMIIEKEKHCSFQEAKEYIKILKKEFRYVQDVY